MNRISLGFEVKDVRGRRVGTVTALVGDCFEVSSHYSDERWNLTQESIFNVVHETVELVCDHDQLHRFPCLVHVRPSRPPD